MCDSVRLLFFSSSFFPRTLSTVLVLPACVRKEDPGADARLLTRAPARSPVHLLLWAPVGRFWPPAGGEEKKSLVGSKRGQRAWGEIPKDSAGSPPSWAAMCADFYVSPLPITYTHTYTSHFIFK